MSGKKQRHRFGTVSIKLLKETGGMAEVNFFLRNAIFPN